MAALCATRSWPCFVCTSISGFSNLLEKAAPRAIVTRHKLGDGYSDDILASLKQSGLSSKTVVLAPANFTAQQEARQIALGADCLLRDPVRLDVLFEYLAKYRSLPLPRAGGAAATVCFQFGGAHIYPQEHRIARNRDSVQATPREIEFLLILARSPGKVVTYQTLYAELLGRNFSGDTVNMRVLLSKTATSLHHVGVNLRKLVHIIPKAGYQYLPAGLPTREENGKLSNRT